MKNNSKQRLFEIMSKLDNSFKPKLNESGAYNDAGEPLMTHNQYRDYSEPSEPEYDDNRNDFEREQSPKDVIKQLEQHFDTIIPSSGNDEYGFLVKGISADLMVWFNNKNNTVNASIYVEGQNGEKKFPETNVEELDMNQLFQFFEPYRQYILAGQDAMNQMASNQKQDNADAQYGRQERAAMGGGLGEAFEPDYTPAEFFEDNLEEILQQMIQSNMNYTDDDILHTVDKLVKKLRHKLPPNPKPAMGSGF